MKEIDKFLDEGKKLFKEEEYVRAIEKFAMILGKRDDELARQYLGRCYFRMEKYDIACQHFSEIRDNSTGEYRDYAEAMLATIDAIRGNYERAISILKSLPRKPWYQINLSIAYWKLYEIKKEESLLKEIEEILDRLKKDDLNKSLLEKGFHLKALVYQAYQDYQQAEEYYQKALELVENKGERGRILTDYESLKSTKQGKKNHNLQLDREVLEALLVQRDWNLRKFSKKLDLEYSHIYQILHNNKSVDNKFIAKMLKFCQREGLNFDNFVSL